MRIAFAELAQETDSFSPLRTSLHEFQSYGLFVGPEMTEQVRGVGPLGGFLEIAAQQPEPIELIPILRAWASAGGIILQDVFDSLRNQLLDGLRAAGPLDAVFLSLHGAASAELDDDVEGRVLEEVRRTVGAEIPIAVALDHHANVTQQMIDNADLLVGHETQPHDPPATGRKAAKLLFDLLRGDVEPVIRWRKIPLITPQDQFLTSGGPMKDWFDRARELEQRPGVLDVSPYPMQPWLDVFEGGWSVIVHTDRDPELADALAAEMAQLAWQMRDRFWESGRVPVANAVQQIIDAPAGLLIVSDTGDSVYGGSPGDSTVILRELLQRTGDLTRPVLLPVIDPVALQQVIDAGAGSELTFELGGRFDNVFSQPVTVTARVESVSPGHLATVEGRGSCEFGRSALVSSGALRIVILEQRTFAINHPLLYTHHGLEIEQAVAVVLKTASNFQFFEDWRSGLIRADAPGMTQSDLTAFEWKHLPRPIYPLDPMPQSPHDCAFSEVPGDQRA